MAGRGDPANEEDAPCTATTDGADTVADRLAVVRLNPARDQAQQRVNEPWSVHGGDIFSTLRQGKERQGNGIKRNISFNEKLTEEAFVSPCLRVASLRKVVAKKPVPTIGAPPDTIEVTYLVWANPEQGPGFEVDGSNTVTSVGGDTSGRSRDASESDSGASSSTNSLPLWRFGTLCPGDKILAIDGKLIGDTPVMAALPAARSFVLFDVRRPFRRRSEPLPVGHDMAVPSVRQALSSDAETPMRQSQPRPTKPVATVSEGGLSEWITHVITVVATAGKAAQLALNSEQVVTGELSLSSSRGSAVDAEGSASCVLRVGDQIVAINGRPLYTGESLRQVLGQLQAETRDRRGGLKRYNGEIRCVLTLLRRSFRSCAARKRSTSMLGSLGGKVRKFIETPPTNTLTAYNKVHEVASCLARELDALTVDEMRCSHD